LTKKINIVIIGTGNVAKHLVKSFQLKEHLQIVQLFNHRRSNDAVSLSKTAGCNLQTDYTKIDATADIYLLAVKDEVISEVISKIKILNIKGVVAHTSGSVSMSMLKGVSHHIGVYYPLQTFHKNAIIDWRTTPLLIEGETRKSLALLRFLASTVSDKVLKMTSVERLQLHLAAVFACNFTNALYAAAFELVEEHVGKNRTSLLLPLIRQTVSKLDIIHPKEAQTGPAKRQDKSVMRKHLTLLQDNPQLTTVYKKLSELIQTQQNIHHGKF
jgi:predicted short-subunit dehydrogenase-like oxidoreductase (DUF2520 family)